MGYNDIKKSGYTWSAFYDLLYLLVTNWNAALTKLDTDLGDTTLNTDHAVTDPSIGPNNDTDVGPLGGGQGNIVSICKQLRTNFNAAIVDMVADDGINETTLLTAQKFGATEQLIDVANARAKALGEHQDGLVDFLDNFVDQFNKVLDLLDGDSQVTDTDYFSTYGIGDVVEVSSSSSSSRSSSSSSSSVSSSSSSSSSLSSSSSSSISVSSSSSSSSSSLSSSSSSSSSLSLSSSSSSSSSSSLSSSSSSSSSTVSSSSSSSSSNSSSSSSSSSQSVG